VRRCHPDVLRDKQQTLVDFVDISGAYDNLCDQMHQAQLPARIVRVMWNLLWRKEIVFYYENQPVAECMGFKCLQQGFALSPFTYIFYTSEAPELLNF
jgi:hypothetical protein